MTNVYQPAIDTALRVIPYHRQEGIEEAVNVLDQLLRVHDLVVLEIAEPLVHSDDHFPEVVPDFFVR